MILFGLVLFGGAVCSGAMGAIALVLAGRRESRGLLDDSRAMTRRGGLLLAASSLACIPGAVLFMVGAPISFNPFGFATLLLFGSSAFVGLLAGLSRKPRPSGGIAVGLFVLGVGCALALLG